MSDPGALGQAIGSLHAAMAATEGMHSDRGNGPSGEDHFARAAGRTCQNCDRPIEAREPARRRGEDGWVHDVCPPALDW